MAPGPAELLVALSLGEVLRRSGESSHVVAMTATAAVASRPAAHVRFFMLPVNRVMSH